VAGTAYSEAANENKRLTNLPQFHELQAIVRPVGFARPYVKVTLTVFPCLWLQGLC
jgi:hypothetical protein